MGIAEITPGISGATIAGLFNVYKDFVNFLNVFKRWYTLFHPAFDILYTSLISIDGVAGLYTNASSREYLYEYGEVIDIHLSPLE